MSIFKNLIANIFYEIAYNGTNSENHSKAIYWYERCLKVKPNDHEAWMNRGLSLALVERFEEALNSFDKSIHIKPDSYEVWKFKGECLGIDMNRHREAIECYEKALKLNPNDYKVWNNQGGSLVKIGLLKEAQLSFQKSLELKPDYYPAVSALNQLKKIIS